MISNNIFEYKPFIFIKISLNSLKTPSAAHPNYTYLAIPPCPMPGECVTLKVIHISVIKEGYINTPTYPLTLY